MGMHCPPAVTHEQHSVPTQRHNICMAWHRRVCYDTMAAGHSL